MGGKFIFCYDKRRNRIYVKSPDNSNTFMNYSIAGDVVESFDHLLRLTKMLYNHRHQMTAEINPDGSSRKWTLDFFGVAQDHQDLTGRVITFLRNFNKKVTRETSTNNPSLPSAVFQPGYINQNGAPQPRINLTLTDPAPLSTDKEYGYSHGLLTSLDDKANNMKETYGYDSDDRRDELTIQQRDTNLMLRHVKQIANEAGDKARVEDTNYPSIRLQ